MDKNILVTVIGKGTARPTNYAIVESKDSAEGKESIFRTEDDAYVITGNIINKKYPFRAAEELLTNNVFDSVYMIGTLDSSWDNLCRNIRNEEDGRPRTAEEEKTEFNNMRLQNAKKVLKEWEEKEKKIEIPENPKQITKAEKKDDGDFKKLEQELEELIGKPVKIVIIEEGKTTWETDQNIKSMMDSFSGIFQKDTGTQDIEKINITLDISNGLRSIPMYVHAMIDYFSVLESKKYVCNMKIVYGMYDVQKRFQKKIYDAKVSEVEKEPSDIKINGSDNYPIKEYNVASMLQMDSITDITKWSSAVREFYANGSVRQLLKLLEPFHGRQASEKETPQKSWVDNCYKNLSNFSFAMNSNNLYLFECSIRDMELLSKQACNVENDEIIPIYARKILESILKNLTERFGSESRKGDKEKYSSYMFAIAKWYFEQKRYGDTAIALQEGLLTYVMEKYPDQCKKLLEKKVRNWNPDSKLKEKLFDGSVRKVLREHIFEQNDEDAETDAEKKEWLYTWRKWREEYDYICNYIRNSAMLMSYHDDESICEKAGDDNNASIELAESKIRQLLEKIEKEREKKCSEQGMLALRLEYLLQLPEYDVFISYRRSFNNDKEYDGVLLVTAISDYLSKQNLKVFMDVNKLEGKSGMFTEHLRMALLNSRCCLVVLGNHAYEREYSERDEYYKEIITAVNNDIKIFVACMEGFSLKEAGKGVLERKELKEVAEKYQRIGSSDTDIWKYQQIWALREKIFKEIHKFFEAEG